MHADGSGQRSITAQAAISQHGDFSPDGFDLAFMSNRTGTYRCTWSVPLAPGWCS
jgi:Tol biopolymer transport system component